MRDLALQRAPCLFDPALSVCALTHSGFGRSQVMMKVTLLSPEKTMNSKFLMSKNALCLSPCIALCLIGVAHAQTAPSPAASAMSGSAKPGHMSQDRMGGVTQMQSSGDVDKDFAMNMKMHHQNAVDMSQMELQHGKSPEMKAMAKQIIAAQKKEIAQFDRWLAKHK